MAGWIVPIVGAGAVSMTATISAGTSLSGTVDLGTARLSAIVMPAAWTTAPLTFTASADGVSFFPLYDDTGTEVTSTVSAGQVVVLSSPAKFMGLRFLQIRSGTTATPVNQAQTAILTLVSDP